MDKVTNNLKPSNVFKYFEEISQIPRGSGNEKGISDYLVNFAKEHKLDVIQDSAYNIIIKKPASAGYEAAPGVIIQGHMDMVCEKNQSTVHDFEKDPIKLRLDGDMIYAQDTTLGADDGMAIAYALAILSSDDIAHPAIEALFTVEEETGMGGAAALDGKNISGKYLVNIDSEEEGQLLVSCSGGVRTIVTLPLTFEDAKAGLLSYKLSIRGLKGGHSGMEINKYRGNSNKIMGRILNDLSSDFEFYISSINGGSKMNAIPREADVIIHVDSENADKLAAKVGEWTVILQNELRVSDPDVIVILNKADANTAKVFSTVSAKNAIAALVLIPSGVQTMSMDIEGLVESSTNLGVVTTTDSSINYESAVRSCIRTLKLNIVNQQKMIASLIGAEFNSAADYPEWQYNADSKLKPIFEKVYKDMYGKDPQIVAIHAGVECGLFSEKMPHLDMISLGPDMFDVHTPNEHISISSVERTWNYLINVLKEIN